MYFLVSAFYHEAHLNKPDVLSLNSESRNDPLFSLINSNMIIISFKSLGFAFFNKNIVSSTLVDILHFSHK